ncbi:MAG: D-glycero-alpha-D-manno-heptose-1,7-bisphosphate 7-phosphatase [Mucilaginibacter sp.]
MSAKAVFLDKDGTLIIDVPYNVSPDKIIFSDNCFEGLRQLQNSGYLLIVITNQSGVARGMFTEDALVPVQQKIEDVLKQNHIRLDGFYYCPHHPEGTIPQFAIDCDCRKPMPGLLKRAAADMDVSLKDSWMIGDILNDVEAGNSAGCRSILIDNGNETVWARSKIRTPIAMLQSINEAANYILNSQ